MKLAAGSVPGRDDGEAARVRSGDAGDAGDAGDPGSLCRMLPLTLSILLTGSRLMIQSIIESTDYRCEAGR